jgi:hypothetical protein
MSEARPAAAATDAPAPVRPPRQNVDEAIVVRWRDGIAIVELVSTVRRKHRRRTPAAEPAEAAPSERPSTPSTTQGDPPEECNR